MSLDELRREIDRADRELVPLLCRRMELSALPRERVMGELEKALLKADRPSVFLEQLRRMKQLSVWFPEAQALISQPYHNGWTL